MPAVSAVRSVSVEEYVGTLPAHEREVARHVLLGGFNKRGRPVGFHHAPNGVAPPGRRIDRILKQYPDGTYLAQVSIWDDQRGWVPKGGLHSMFPDHWRADHVLRAGWQTYGDRPQRQVLRWRSEFRGMRIGGFRRPDAGGPATFFPDLSR